MAHVSQLQYRMVETFSHHTFWLLKAELAHHDAFILACVFESHVSE